MPSALIFWRLMASASASSTWRASGRPVRRPLGTLPRPGRSRAGKRWHRRRCDRRAQARRLCGTRSVHTRPPPSSFAPGPHPPSKTGLDRRFERFLRAAAESEARRPGPSIAKGCRRGRAIRCEPCARLAGAPCAYCAGQPRDWRRTSCRSARRRSRTGSLGATFPHPPARKPRSSAVWPLPRRVHSRETHHSNRCRSPIRRARRVQQA